MPLSSPAPRKPMHTRTVECRGYVRDDGLWDIEGHLTDTKPFAIPNEDRGGEIPAGEPLHEMWIRLTVDTDLVVCDVEVCTDHSPYSICGNIVENFKALKGVAIKAGWTQKTRELLGGTKGCTHLVELLGPIATTAFQTVYPARIKRDKHQQHTHRPGLIDSCHAYASGGPVVMRRWPRFYTGSK
jgi:hypothetical protein